MELEDHWTLHGCGKETDPSLKFLDPPLQCVWLDSTEPAIHCPSGYEHAA